MCEGYPHTNDAWRESIEERAANISPEELDIVIALHAMGDYDGHRHIHQHIEDDEFTKKTAFDNLFDAKAAISNAQRYLGIVPSNIESFNAAAQRLEQQIIDAANDDIKSSNSQ